MIFLLACLLFGNAQAQDANCDFFQNVQVATRYYITSPNHPGSYQRSKVCRWIAYCPSGYQCRVDCTIELPTTSGCSGDKVLISRTGDPQLNNATTYCGRQTLTVLSVGQSLSIGLITTSSTTGGRFSCDLTAQAVIPPAPTCVCGVRRQNRIVGGNSTGVTEFTMMVAVIEKSIQAILCGATIITNNHVVLAAHCVTGQTPQSIFLSMGNRDLTLGDKYNVTSIKIHPNYNSQTYVADVAVLTVTPSIKFSDTVTPVCLPFNYVNMDFTGAIVTIAGWGTTSFGGPTVVNLLQTEVKIISLAECQRFKSTITNSQICTLTPGKDSCQYDSGGPLLYTEPNTGSLILIGVISNGVGCGTRTPAYNTRFSEYLNWTVANAPGTYCVKK